MIDDDDDDDDDDDVWAIDDKHGMMMIMYQWAYQMSRWSTTMTPAEE